MMEVDRNTIYGGAIGMQLDSIAEITALLDKAKAKSGETETWKFWKRQLDIAKHSYAFMMDMEPMMRERDQLKQENSYMRWALAKEKDINMAIRSLAQSKINGNFSETVAMVTELFSIAPELLERISR
jgi:hypothetical protein